MGQCRGGSKTYEGEILEMKMFSAHHDPGVGVSASLRSLLGEGELQPAHFHILEQTYGRLLETIQDYAIALLNPDGLIAVWSAGGEHLIGYSANEMLSKHFSLIFPNRDISTGIPEQLLHRVLTTGHAQDERQWMKRDGSRFWGKLTIIGMSGASGGTIGYAMVLQDLSQQTGAQAGGPKRGLQRTNSTNSSTIPSLPSESDSHRPTTGSRPSTHTLNNILTSLLGFSELALADSSGLPGRVSRYLEEIHSAALRARDLTQDLSGREGDQTPVRTSIRLLPFLGETLGMLNLTLPDHLKISFRSRIKEGADVVSANGNEICHLITSICSAGVQVAKTTGGTLGVTLAAQTRPGKEEETVAMRGFILLEFHVSDMGERTSEKTEPPGGSQEGNFPVKDHAFGQLDSIRRTVQELGGELQSTYQSPTHHVVSILLPQSKSATMNLRLKYSPHFKNPEHILVVDDEESVSSLLKEMLTQLGYIVDVADTGEEAMRIFQEDPDRFDLVLTDHTLPRMTGNSLVKDLLTCRPDLPIILCSGWSLHSEEDRISDLGIKHFLPKPIEFEKLSQVVRNVLDKGRPTSASPFQ